MFKKWIFVILFFLLFAQITNANNYVEKTLDGYKFRYIKYDTDSKDYIFKIWANPDYSATNLRELMEANNWVSAINWVFFCPASYGECGWKNFTKNERYVEWVKIWPSETTWDRVVFAVDENSKPFLFQSNKINSLDEDKIYYGFANFPLLLKDGVSKFQEYVDLWLVDKKMTNKMQRNFICSDRTNKLIYTWYISEIELGKLPDVLKKLGCYNALNLDAGWSSAMVYNWRYLIWPGRDVMDWVVIERKGLDTKLVIEKAKKIEWLIDKKLDAKSYSGKIEYLDNITKGLAKIRTKVYTENSFDLFDNDAWKIIWYEINIKSITNLEKVYMINYLNKLFAELKETYKLEDIEKQKEEKEKLNEEKEKIDGENLLF